jgi:protein-S-isoprenylcysteine O-methyltransferase Ste14
MMPNARDASSPFRWPPVIYAAAALVSGLLSWVAPWQFGSAQVRDLLQVAGILLGMAGVLIATLAALRFRAAGTAVHPTEPTTAIVSTGVYQFTRNPMYLGMSLGLAGLGLALDQLWFLVALPAAMVAVTKLAIEREEAYLAAKFGSAYLAYQARVRRWL